MTLNMGSVKENLGADIPPKEGAVVWQWVLKLYLQRGSAPPPLASISLSPYPFLQDATSRCLRIKYQVDATSYFKWHIEYDGIDVTSKFQVPILRNNLISSKYTYSIHVIFMMLSE